VNIADQSSSNGAQFIYALLYLLLIYNITLISQEYDWGMLEHQRKRLRCTIVKGECFKQDYLLQLPKKILFPIMTYSVITHWMLGEALQTQEAVWMDYSPDLNRHVEHSKYMVCFSYTPHYSKFMLTTTDHICRISPLGSHRPHPPDDHHMLVGIHLPPRRLHSTNVRQHPDALLGHDATR
jgi:hypothetical protein